MFSVLAGLGLSTHLLKDTRIRIVLGTLAADAQSATITAACLNTSLKIGKSSVAHSPLDLLKDDLALKIFTLGNLLTLGRNLEVVGAYFFFPFVSLNLAITCDRISEERRLNVLHVAVFISFKTMKEFPRARDEYGIHERSTKPTDRSTLWT
jgi:hypothetical protein